MKNYLELHRTEIFKKYNDEALLRDIHNYKYGRGRLSKVLNHFFEECIYECRSTRYKYTPMEVLQDQEMMEWILDYVESKPKFYNGGEISNVKSFFRNGTRYARKVANFCPRNARDIYFRYHDINGERLNILDTSMGFGSRMSSVLLNGHNYCGVDPNPQLFEKLKEYHKFLGKHELIGDTKCGMYCKGSEEFIAELINKFDVSFTSPPYFDLEVYGNDKSQSIVKCPTYGEWLESFVKPTIDNTHKYLKVGGYAMINVKNLTTGKKEPLFDDWFNIFKSHGGFEFVEVFEMKHQSKKNYVMNCNYDSSAYIGFKEPIMVFRKI